MGSRNRIAQFGRPIALLAVGAAGGGAALAVASVPDGNGVVHACVAINPASGAPTLTANVRVIDTSIGQTCSTSAVGGQAPEETVNWNTIGPQGLQGPAGTPGVPGAPGAPGAKGPPGADGRTLTAISGSTLTIAGGQVITVGGGSGVTITPPPVNVRRSAGTLTLGSPAIPSDVLSFSFAGGSHGSGGAGGGGTGRGGGGSGVGGGGSLLDRRGLVHDISISRRFDGSSPKLSLYCATGKHFPKATLVIRKAGKGAKSGPVAATYTFTDVLISSYQLSGSSKDGTLVDLISLNFTKLTVK